MANKIIKELQAKTNQELSDLISQLKMKLLEIRFNIANGDTEDSKNIKEIKKTIARILTILNQRASTIPEQVQVVVNEGNK